MTTTDPTWFTVRLALEPDQVEAAEEALFEAGAQAVTLLDAEDNPVHEPGPGERLLWPEVLAEALFDQRPDSIALTSRLAAQGILIDASALHVAALEDRDWVRAWMDAYAPMRFGQELWICPSHVEPDPSWPRVIRLDPGLAFGSGTHPTTALCLEWLDRRDLGGQTVIDYGCGSGVLAIGAALQGADRIIAVDHDPQALEATRDNASRNGVKERIEVALPEEFQPVEADVVLANILAGPLIELAPRLADCLAPGGSLVISGVLAAQADEVAEAYRDRLGEPQIIVNDDWARLLFERASQPSGAGP